MASNIVSTTIDATYPVAGQDNDTQGFRDNFSIIKSNFTAAKAEIETLQTNTPKLNTNNNFGGHALINAKIQGSGLGSKSQMTLVGDIELPWIEASYYSFIVNNDVTLTLTDWPLNGSGILGYVMVEVTAATTARTVTFETANGTLRFAVSNVNPITIANDGNTRIYEFWTNNGGATVFGRLMGNFD